jgi:hypothetical protein
MSSKNELGQMKLNFLALGSEVCQIQIVLERILASDDFSVS